MKVFKRFDNLFGEKFLKIFPRSSIFSCRTLLQFSKSNQFDCEPKGLPEKKKLLPASFIFFLPRKSNFPSQNTSIEKQKKILPVIQKSQKMNDFSRYRAILNPLRQKPSKFFSVVVIVFIWFASLAFALPMGLVFHKFDYVDDQSFSNRSNEDVDDKTTKKPFCFIDLGENDTYATAFKSYR